MIDYNPECENCHGTGEYFTHSENCENDFCALAGGYEDCRGQIVQCDCNIKKNKTMTTYPKIIRAGALSFRYLGNGRYSLHGPSTVAWDDLVKLKQMEIGKHESENIKRNQRYSDHQGRSFGIDTDCSYGGSE